MPADIEKVFLTGGTGFLGQEIARRLTREGRTVALLTRDPARLPLNLQGRVQVVRGTLEDSASYEHALRGCHAVIHCAKADAKDDEMRGRLDIAGTTDLLDAAIKAKVNLFQQISSIAVYGVTPDGIVDEDFPYATTGDAYTRSKIHIEQELSRRGAEINIVILRPANIYGPGLCWWSHTLLEMMRRGRLMMINSGTGLANMVHVFDVAEAVRLALDKHGVNGQPLIISGTAPVRWSDYFEGLERILGRRACISLTVEEAKALSHRLVDPSLWRRAHRWLSRVFFRQPVIFPIADEAIEKFAARTVFSIDKAKRVLGYSPEFDIDTGLDTVKEFESSLVAPRRAG